MAGVQVKNFESPDEVRRSKAAEGLMCSTSAAR